MRIKGQEVSEPEPFFKLSSFWSPELHQELCGFSDKQVVDRLDELLNESVRKHMIADTAVAALCSGGVDSSLILALASRQSDNLAIFHSDVVGRHSERDAAEALARHLKLDLKVVEVQDQDFIDSIPKVTRHYGQPFAYHPNCVPFLKVTELVRDHNIKVILTGEAADESYLGYSHIPTEDMIAKIQHVLARFKSLLGGNPILGKVFHSGNSNNAPLIGLMSRYEEFSEAYDLERELRENNLGTFDAQNFKTFRYLTYHLRTLLHRNDSLGMASSIEARFPFLDHDAIQFACNLPYRHKIRFSGAAWKEKKHPFLMTKWAVRQVADRYLPQELSYRPKRGFPTDAFERMQIDCRMFKNSFVSELFRASVEESSCMAMLPDKNLHMRLMLLEVWGRTFFWKQSQSEVQSMLREHIKLPAEG